MRLSTSLAFAQLLVSCVAGPAFGITGEAQPNARDTWLETEIAQGRPADVDRYCSKVAGEQERSDPAACHRLTSTEFRALIADRKDAGETLVSIAHAAVVGVVDLSRATIKDEIVLDDVTLQDGLLLHETRFDRDVAIRGSDIAAVFDATNADLHGSVTIAQSRIRTPGNDILMSGLKVAGSLVLSHLEMTSKAKIEMSGAVIGGDVKVDNCSFSSSLMFTRAKVTGLVDVADSSFARPVDLTEIDVGGGFSNKNTEYGDKLDFERGHTNGSFKLINTTIKGPAILQGVSIGGDFQMLGGAAMGGIDGKQSRIAGSMSFENKVMLSGSVGLDASTNTFNSDTSDRRRTLDLLSSSIGGTFEMDHAEVAGAVILGLGHVSSVALHDTRFDDNLDFVGLHVESHFDVGGSHLSSIDLTRARIDGDFRIAYTKRKQWADWHGANELILRHAHLSVIQDDYDPRDELHHQWPKTKNIEGLTYEHFGIPRRAEWYGAWLSAASSPQPYEQAALVLKAEGEKDKADEVRFDERVDDIRRAKAECFDKQFSSCLQAGALTVSRYFIGFGIGTYLYRIFGWIVFFVILGALILIESPDAKRRGPIWCLGASLNHLIPLLELNKEFSDYFDDPDRKRLGDRQLIYFGAHAIVGYIIVSFVAAAISGLTQGN